MAGLLWLRGLHAERATAAEEAQVPGFARSVSSLTAVRVRASVYSRIKICGAAGAPAACVGAVLSTAGRGMGERGRALGAVPESAGGVKPGCGGGVARDDPRRAALQLCIRASAPGPTASVPRTNADARGSGWATCGQSRVGRTASSPVT